MVNLQKIKDEVAVKHGYQDWHSFMYISGRPQISELSDEAMKEYAKQCCQLQIEACAENAKVMQGGPSVRVDKESILNTNNVCDDR